jgi:hypothetical protein
MNNIYKLSVIIKFKEIKDGKKTQEDYERKERKIR